MSESTPLLSRRPSWKSALRQEVAVDSPAARLALTTQCFIAGFGDAAVYAPVKTWIAFMVSPATRHLVAEWLRYARDPRVVTDIPNQLGLPDFDGFIDHRFDQSILSNLIYKLDLEIPALREPSKRIRTLIDEFERDALVWARPSENIALGKAWRASSASMRSRSPTSTTVRSSLPSSKAPIAPSTSTAGARSEPIASSAIRIFSGLCARTLRTRKLRRAAPCGNTRSSRTRDAEGAGRRTAGTR